MKKLEIVLLFGAIFLIASFIFAAAAGPQEDYRIITASGHESWGPVMYHNGYGYIVGQAPEILEEALNGTIFHVTTKYVGDWDLVQQKARTSEVDIIVALYKTEERESYLLYSLPYLEDPIAIFVSDKSLTDLTVAQVISEKEGIVTKGDSYGTEIDELLKTTDILVAQNPEEAKELLLSGKGDYFLFSLYGGEDLFEKELSSDEIFSSVVGSEYFYFGVSKKTPDAEKIIQILNDYIRENDLLLKNKQ